MKNFRIILVVMAIFAMGVIVSSCGDKATKSNTKTEEVNKQGKEYTSVYICPMHCEGSGSDKPGTCPACGMDYVKNEDEHAGHNH